MALTKSDIVATVHELGFTKKKSVEIIETLLEIIKSSLEHSEDVLISGFGKFCVKEKKKSMGLRRRSKPIMKMPRKKIWPLQQGSKRPGPKA